MTLIGQPEGYSDMLRRIFAATLVTGIGCTFWIATVSPQFRAVLDGLGGTASVGLFEGVQASYVLIPLFVAVLARVFLLHDRISDLLQIRSRFDVFYILRPLAEGVGISPDLRDVERLSNHRRPLMSRAFYRYASFTDPKIERQVVRTAADRWAWFWCTVEPWIVLIPTGVTFAALGFWRDFGVVLGIGLLLFIMSVLLWPLLKRSARVQVREILDNSVWKSEVSKVMTELLMTAGAEATD